MPGRSARLPRQRRERGRERAAGARTRGRRPRAAGLPWGWGASDPAFRAPGLSTAESPDPLSGQDWTQPPPLPGLRSDLRWSSPSGLLSGEAPETRAGCPSRGTPRPASAQEETGAWVTSARSSRLSRLCRRHRLLSPVPQIKDKLNDGHQLDQVCVAGAQWGGQRGEGHSHPARVLQSPPCPTGGPTGCGCNAFTCSGAFCPGS